MIDFEPSEEQALIIETVHQFAENEIRPKGRETDESGTPPASVLSAAHELGLIANGLPESGEVEEKEALTGALIAGARLGGHVLAFAILSPGLVRFHRGPRFGCAPIGLSGLLVASSRSSLAIVEPASAGVFHPHTTARRDSGAYVVDGRKYLVPWLWWPARGGRRRRERRSPRSCLRRARPRRHARQNMGLCGLPTVGSLEGSRARRARLDASDADLRRLIPRGRIAIATAVEPPAPLSKSPAITPSSARP
jgi:hypothetical protein